MNYVFLKGVEFTLDCLHPKKIRLNLLEYVQFENHKGTTISVDILDSKLKTEVRHTFAPPISKKNVPNIEGKFMDHIKYLNIIQ